MTQTCRKAYNKKVNKVAINYYYFIVHKFRKRKKVIRFNVGKCHKLNPHYIKLTPVNTSKKHKIK